MDNRPLSDNFYQNIKPATTYINKLYDKTTFADNYGSSILICILVTLFVLTVFLYCLFMQKKKEIYADWNNNRCKPQYIPIAGFIMEYCFSGWPYSCCRWRILIYRRLHYSPSARKPSMHRNSN